MDKEAIIDAGSEFEILVDLQKGEMVVWSFEVEYLDVGFKVEWLPSNQPEDESLLDPADQDARVLLSQSYPPQRYNSDGGCHAGEFVSPSNGRLLLNWSNSYSYMRSKSIRYGTQVITVEQIQSHSEEECKNQGLNRDQGCVSCTFQEYFEIPLESCPIPITRAITEHYTPVHSSETKNFPSCGICFSKDFPLSIEQILPVVEIMARSKDHWENFSRFFRTKMPEEGFPVKFQIPIFPTVSATVSFIDCQIFHSDDEMDSVESMRLNEFRVPDDYDKNNYEDRSLWKQL